MICGVHTMFYSSRAAELRAFLRDKLDFPFTDVGEGWLIFDLPEAEMGVHPSDDSHPNSRAGTHAISFYCDDIAHTVADLRAKGIEFIDEPQDQGYGIVTQFKAPGDVVVQLYQPHYKKRSHAKPAAPVAKAAARKRQPKKAVAAKKKQKPAKGKANAKPAKKKKASGRKR
jgi:catechol 2,3-dioxygenase-like lactoylglutathione lyase family enzyme